MCIAKNEKKYIKKTRKSSRDWQFELNSDLSKQTKFQLNKKKEQTVSSRQTNQMRQVIKLDEI